MYMYIRSNEYVCSTRLNTTKAKMVTMHQKMTPSIIKIHPRDLANRSVAAHELKPKSPPKGEPDSSLLQF